MSSPTINETGRTPPPEIPAFPLQSDKNVPPLCGPGCACDKPALSGKLKIVIMLIIVAAVAIASIFKEIL